MRSLVDRLKESDGGLDFDVYVPETMLSRDELKLVRALCRRQRAWLNERVGSFRDSLTPKQARLKQSYWEAGQQLSILATDVLRRECGIEKLMVLHVVRDDGYEVWMQVEHLGLMDRFGSAAGLFAWELHGARLRKDKTIGSLGERTAFRLARIERRCLDGHWMRLTPEGQEQ